MTNNIMEPEPRAEAVPPAEKPRHRWEWKLMLVVAVVLVAFVALRPRNVDAKFTTEAAATVPVATVRVVHQDLAQNRNFEAEFRPFEEIEVYAKVSGFLETINVDVGDRVEAGQVLATLEVPELQDDLDHAVATQKRSEDEVNRAKAAYDETHVVYNRLVAADKEQPHLIAQQDLDQAQSKDHASEATLAAAREQVTISAADVKKLKTMLGYCKIIAPFSGVITKRYTDPGALIHVGSSAGSPLVRLSQNDRLRLVFPISVSYVSCVNIGDPIAVHVQSLDRHFSAKISRFTRKIDTATRTMDVEADIPNPDLKLIPGMYATISATTEQHKNALVVPVEAVSRQKTSATVFLVNKEGKIEERAVKLGLETPTELEILDGLAEGDEVMIGSRTQVRVGQKVSAKLLKGAADKTL